MKILYAASEVAPFCKTGGLGDVAGSLPQALAAGGAEVSVVLPLYECIPDDVRAGMTYEGSVSVQLAWRSQGCGVRSLKRNGVAYYFIDNSYYFRRRELYGHYDDGERFAFFSKACLDLLPALGSFPDVIIANDWQASLIPAYLKLLYYRDARYRAVRTMLTIHNIQYQGRYSREFLSDVAGIDDSYCRNGIMAYDDGICLLKGGILCADSVVTVSPTYAREICTPEYGFGLDAVLRDNAFKLNGILNGLKTEAYDPAALAIPYTAAAPEKKAENKAALQSILGLHQEPGTPVVALISRLAGHKGIDLITEAGDLLMNEPIQLAVLGKGEWQYEQYFTELAARFPGRVSTGILFDEELARKIYAGADMLLVPSRSEPCGLTQMMAMRYGTVPIVRETGGLKDTVLDYGCGGDSRGFTFRDYTASAFLDAVRRAVALYFQSPAQWKGLQWRGMTADFTWDASAKRYLALCREILEK